MIECEDSDSIIDDDIICGKLCENGDCIYRYDDCDDGSDSNIPPISQKLFDDRYDEDYIVSHNQRKIKSIQVSDTNVILDYCNKADVFGIDEAQFFDNSITMICRHLANEGKRVVVAGLEKDYLANGFGPMPNLLVDAEYITKVNAICMVCGDPANFSYRISTEKNQVVLGETNKYEARCRKCFNESN